MSIPIPGRSGLSLAAALLVAGLVSAGVSSPAAAVTCKSNSIKAESNLLIIKKRARRQAKRRWSSKVQRTYGLRWASWARAKSKLLRCD